MRNLYGIIKRERERGGGDRERERERERERDGARRCSVMFGNFVISQKLDICGMCIILP